MISKEYIEDILIKWSKTKDGRKLLKEKFGIESLTSESQSEKNKKDIDFMEYSKKMIDILYNQIFLTLYAGSNRYHHPMDMIFEKDINVTLSKTSNGKTIAKIGINSEKLGRDSLYPDGYYGDDAIQDILALYTHGYKARDYVYGIYEHRQAGNWRKGRSRIERKPDDFLMKAVQEFNIKYGDVAVAKLEDRYIHK